MPGEEKIKLYLDEDVRPLLAEILRGRGYDVVSCIEKKLIGLSDEEQIKYAIKEKRTLFTHNIKDFVRLHKKYCHLHYGIILAEQISFKVLVHRILKFYLRSSVNEVKGKIVWLGSNFD